MSVINRYTYFPLIYSDKTKSAQFKIKSLGERDDSGDSEYWAKYAQVICSKKERLWDALLEGLEKYRYSMLLTDTRLLGLFLFFFFVA